LLPGKSGGFPDPAVATANATAALAELDLSNIILKVEQNNNLVDQIFIFYTKKYSTFHAFDCYLVEHQIDFEFLINHNLRNILVNSKIT
jgi:hypothetical protein